MQRFEFLRQTLLGELAMSRKKEREKEKKMPFIVATYVYASSQGQRTHSARTNFQVISVWIGNKAFTDILDDTYYFHRLEM